jgi:predicted alternative tryptophan synthase beta-subunit
LTHLAHIDKSQNGQRPTFEAAVMFARAEGYLPAPESAHAIRVVIDEALRCRESGEAKTIAFNLSGHTSTLARPSATCAASSRTTSTRRTRREALAGIPKVAV